MPNAFQNMLLIANPAAQNGNGARAVRQAERLLCERMAGALVVRETSAPLHAVEIAREAKSFDVVVALGGDGIIHEVVNGLMQRPLSDRPTFGIVPIGSGNDYAASLGVSGKLEKAADQLFTSAARMADVGCCNGEYFTETVSFGLDAAIALDTVERRKRTGKTGTALYFAAGVDQMLHHLTKRSYKITLDDTRTLEGESYILAVQNGPTYGGGFKVCPQARMNDGALDVCIAHPPLTPLTATGLFMLAKEGLHKGFRQIEFARAARMRIEFEEQPPAQIDGELLCGTAFDIEILPQALRVLAPSDHVFTAVSGKDYVRIPE